MRLKWNQTGDRLFETGVDRGVLFPKYTPNGVAWSGLIGMSEDPSGGDLSSYYIDGVKYLDVMAGEDFAATLEAFASPPEFAVCDGSKQLARGLFATQQPRQSFGLSYRTLIGNDVEGTDHGYKVHLVYNCLASPSSRSIKTISDSPEATPLSWTLSTVPPVVARGYRPTAHFVVDSTKSDALALAYLEQIIYGSDVQNPRLPSQDEVIQIMMGSFTEVITEPLSTLI